MVIIGAKGFAKELLEVCHLLGRTENLVFFDNVSTDLPSNLFGQFPILRTETEVKNYFDKNDNLFALGLGNPFLRKQLSTLIESWGGELTSIISPKAKIGCYNIDIGQGATILCQASITTSIKIGKGLLMYTNSIITHDCYVGDFAELSPGATLLGKVTIGNMVHVGANATILPNVSIGDDAVIGAGAVVTKDVPAQVSAVGIPAKW